MSLDSAEHGLLVHLQRELYDLEVIDFKERWNIGDNEASIVKSWFETRITELKRLRDGNK